MTLLRAQVLLQRQSALPQDVFINTFYFRSPGLLGPTPGELDAISLAVGGFYNSNSVGGQQVGQFLSGLLAPGQAHQVKIYNMSQPKPRAPIRIDTFSIAEATGSPLPTEVALCLSYRAPLISGTDPKNRRGRLYIGPLDTSALSSSATSSDILPNVSLMNALRDAGQRLMNLTSVLWVIYSPTTATDLEITNVHVDNAFDTQRRRGGAPSQRVQANKSAV